MTDEERVRAKYPEAVCEFRESLEELGADEPFSDHAYIIRSSTWIDAILLGDRDSEEEAWADAASKLPAS